MDKRKTIPLIVLSLGLMLLGTGLGIKFLASERSPVSERDPVTRICVEPAFVSFEAPELSLNTLNGTPVSLDKYQGKVILINAWATWCPPCLDELPDLEAYFNSHVGDDFVLVGVNIGEHKNTVTEFIDRNPISFPIWLDPGEQTLRELNTVSLPYSIVIDRGGDVRLAWSGATCLETLESAVTPMLRQ